MSIEVPIDQLFADLHLWGPGFLATVSDDGRPRFVCLTPEVVEGDDSTAGSAAMRFRRAGRTAAGNIDARPNVSVVFAAHPGSGGYSLIVDGCATLRHMESGPGDENALDPVIDVRPTWAVLHRPAP